MLRWHIQRGDTVFPKSVTPQRVRENFALFDFELTDTDIDALTALDKGEAGRTGPNPDQFDYIPDSCSCPEWLSGDQTAPQGISAASVVPW